MSEAPKRHRVSYSRKLFGGKVFVNESVEFDDPKDPIERKMVIENILSGGYTQIVEALADRIDDDVEAEIARIRGERRERIGLLPYDKPERKKTTAAPTPAVEIVVKPKIATAPQRIKIKEILEEEILAGGHPGKRNYVEAVLAQEKVAHLIHVSFAGAEKILQQIDPVEAQKVLPEGFKPGTSLLDGDSPAGAYLEPEDVGEKPRPPPMTEEEAREAAVEAAMDADRARAASIAKEEGDDETYDRMMRDLEDRSAGNEPRGDPDTEREGAELSKHEADLHEQEEEGLRNESKEVQLEVAKAEADELEGRAE